MDSPYSKHAPGRNADGSPMDNHPDWTQEEYDEEARLWQDIQARTMTGRIDPGERRAYLALLTRRAHTHDVLAPRPPYLAPDELMRRYPRLIRAMQRAAILSTSEAAAAIRDYRAGRAFSGEAVNHYGGTFAVIAAAIRTRNAGMYPNPKRVTPTGPDHITGLQPEAAAKISHREHAARMHNATPCSAQHITFGGKCLNCGWTPEDAATTPIIHNPPADLLHALQRIADHDTRADRRHRGLVDISEVEDLQRIARLAIAASPPAAPLTDFTLTDDEYRLVIFALNDHAYLLTRLRFLATDAHQKDLIDRRISDAQALHFRLNRAHLPRRG